MFLILSILVAVVSAAATTVPATTAAPTTLTTGEIIAIVIGSVVALAILVGVLIYCGRMEYNRRQADMYYSQMRVRGSGAPKKRTHIK